MTTQTERSQDSERWTERERRWSEIGGRAAKAEESEANCGAAEVIACRMDV